MKVRRTLTLAVGAALGASGMYLLDPEHGAARRRETARQAWHRTREGLRPEPVAPAVTPRDRARTLVERARDGFDGARAGQR